MDYFIHLFLSHIEIFYLKLAILNLNLYLMVEKSTGGIQHFKDGIIDLLAGTAGGAANVYSAQPLDTIKVKMQTFPSIYKNWVLCFRQTYRAEGVRGLYAGSIPALIANVSENSILFFSYGFCQKAVANLVGSPSVKQMTPVQNASAGSMAAFFAALVLCPTELVKCQLQAQTELNPNVKRTPFSISREMYKTSGLRSFYTGFVATLVREIPGYFFFFGAYEFSRKLLTPKGKTKDEIGIFRTAISGGIGGMALWTAIFPADVVKSRMQVGQKGTFSSILMKIYREEGFKAFYKGLSPTLIRTFIASGALFIVYENTKQFLGRF